MWLRFIQPVTLYPILRECRGGVQCIFSVYLVGTGLAGKKNKKKSNVSTRSSRPFSSSSLADLCSNTQQASN